MAEQFLNTEKLEARLARADATLNRTITTLRNLIERSRNGNFEDSVSAERIAVGYHQYRIASERFDTVCREYIDVLVECADPS